MKKLFTVFTAILLICVGFSGCSGDNGSVMSASSTEDSTTVNIISFEDVTFINADAESVYRIVRPEGDTEATASAQYLYKHMKQRLGINIRNVSDSEDGADNYEILVGDCDRSETELAKKYLHEKTGGRYEDYIICTVGKKIIIYSQSPTSLQSAAEYFIANFTKQDGVKGGIEHIYRVQGEYESITVNGVPIDRFSVVRPHYNSSYLTELELNKLTESVFQRTGYVVGIVHDTYTEPSEYEIIVGNTDREGVEAVTDHDEYRITVKGSKVYLNGGSAHATAMAVSEFVKLLTGDVTDKASVVGSYEQALATYDKTVTLYKTWGDDFDGDRIDTNVWKVGNPTAVWQGLNGKMQVRSESPDDVFVKDGMFYICAREDDDYYYGGVIQTHGTYKYGYVEMSSKIPHGTGFWTALYAESNDIYSVIEPSELMMATAEYDIMECFGNSEHYQANIHSWPRNGGFDLGWEHTSLDATHGNEKRYRSVDSGVVLGHGFHTYGMMWDSESVTFTGDADPFFTYDTTTNERDVETNNHSVWLRIAMNIGSATNPEPGITDDPDDWTNTNKFIVDWINVYQKNDGLCELNGKAVG